MQRIVARRVRRVGVRCWRGQPPSAYRGAIDAGTIPDSRPDRWDDDGTTTNAAPTRAQADPTIISARRLTQSFDACGYGRTVLDGLDVDIRRGDFTVIMEPSGAGKSTLLYALAGLSRPTGGTIDFAGERITAMDDDALAVFRRRNCGFVFQQHQLLERMSLIDNVVVAGALTMRPKARIAAKARELFALVHIGEDT